MKDKKKQEDVSLEKNDLLQQLMKTSNRKSPGRDGIHGFWLKKFDILHDKLLSYLNECVGKEDVPSWLVESRTVLIQKDQNKGNVASNYRPIACLNLIWKVFTGMLSEKLYIHVEFNGILPEEQKGCRRRSRGTKDQLLIDKAVIPNCKRRKTNLFMSWIDFRKAYDLVPQSWILESLRIIGAADNMVRLLENSMKNWKTQLTANGADLGTVRIRRGIFQGDSLSPLLFVTSMIPVTIILRSMKQGYSLHKKSK